MIKKHRGLIFRMFFMLLVLCMTMSINLSIDESFTMSLIRNNFMHIISYDAFDVHPPLYYLLLKIFLIIFTFWTKSIIIKIIFARLFSVICLLLSIIIAYKILNILHLKYNKSLLMIALLLISMYMGQITNIRMYDLSTLFINLEILGIIKFIKKNNWKNIFLIICSITLALYTNDFTAVIAGLLLITFFIYYCLKKEFKKVHQLFIAGICSLLVYLPWGYIAIKQMLNVQSGNWISKAGDIHDSIHILFILMILFIPIFILRKYINYRNLLIINCVLIVNMLIILLATVSVLQRPVFQLRYAYPIVFSYVYMIIGVLSDLYKQQHIPKIFHVNYLYIVMIFFALLGIKVIHSSTTSQIATNIPQSIDLVRTFRYKKPNSKINLYNKLDINILTQQRTRPDILYQFYTYAQYKHLRLPNKENRHIYYGKSSNLAAMGTKPKLRKLVWSVNKNY